MSITIFPHVKDIWDRITAQRAGWLDNLNGLNASNLDATISSRASSTEAAKAAQCTEARLSKLDLATAGIGIKSVQRGTKAFADVDTTDTETITAVVLTKAWVVAHSEAVDQTVGVVLTNNTTLTFNKKSAGAGTNNAATVYWQVVEFY